MGMEDMKACTDAQLSTRVNLRHGGWPWAVLWLVIHSEERAASSWGLEGVSPTLERTLLSSRLFV